LSLRLAVWTSESPLLLKEQLSFMQLPLITLERIRLDPELTKVDRNVASTLVLEIIGSLAVPLLKFFNFP